LQKQGSANNIALVKEKVKLCKKIKAEKREIRLVIEYYSMYITESFEYLIYP
jgi:hypothetical protein